MKRLAPAVRAQSPMYSNCLQFRCTTLVLFPMLKFVCTEMLGNDIRKSNQPEDQLLFEPKLEDLRLMLKAVTA
jgi:hypothetical protein